MILPEKQKENIKFYSRKNDESLARITLEGSELVVNYVKNCTNEDQDFLRNYLNLNFEELSNLEFTERTGGIDIQEDGTEVSWDGIKKITKSDSTDFLSHLFVYLNKKEIKTDLLENRIIISYELTDGRGILKL